MPLVVGLLGARRARCDAGARGTRVSSMSQTLADGIHQRRRDDGTDQEQARDQNQDDFGDSVEAQRVVEDADREDAADAPPDRASATEDADPTEDDGGDDDQLEALDIVGLRRGVAQRPVDARQRRHKARQCQGDDAGTLRVDADEFGRLLGIPQREEASAVWGLVQQEPEEDDEHDDGDRHVRNARGSEGAGDRGGRPRREVGDRLVADDDQGEASIQCERTDRDRERRQAHVGGHHGVDEAARQSDEEANRDARPESDARLDEDAEGRADEAGGRGDGQVDVRVDHDEGHGQGHEECRRHVQGKERERAGLAESRNEDGRDHDGEDEDEGHVRVSRGEHAANGGHEVT